jgi:hypothetical protein
MVVLFTTGIQIVMVVLFPNGGSTTLVARGVAASIGVLFKQPLLLFLRSEDSEAKRATVLVMDDSSSQEENLTEAGRLDRSGLNPSEHTEHHTEEHEQQNQMFRAMNEHSTSSSEPGPAPGAMEFGAGEDYATFEYPKLDKFGSGMVTEEDQQIDQVAFFYANPYYYKRRDELIAVDMFDAASERESIESTARSLDIDVQSAVLTASALDDFLSKSNKRNLLLVLSMHGEKTFCGFECSNQIGEYVSIPCQKLKETIKAHQEKISIVILSSCNSSFIGDQVVNAGVEHVVACNGILGDGMHFEEAFIRNLLGESTCTTVELAFKKANEELVDTTAKFRLLPETESHNIPVHKEKIDSNAMQQHTSQPNLNHPRPSHPFLGRHIEQNKLIKAATSGLERVVAVTGLQGAGKTELVKVACQYLYDRNHFDSLKWDEIAWFDYKQQADFANTHPMAKAFVALFDAIGDNQLSETQFWDDDRTGENIGAISAHFHEKKALVVLNFEDLEYENDSGARKAVLLIHELTPKLNSMKIVLIYHDHIYLDLSKVAYTTIS